MLRYGTPIHASGEDADVNKIIGPDQPYMLHPRAAKCESTTNLENPKWSFLHQSFSVPSERIQTVNSHYKNHHCVAVIFHR